MLVGPRECSPPLPDPSSSAPRPKTQNNPSLTPPPLTITTQTSQRQTPTYPNRQDHRAEEPGAGVLFPRRRRLGRLRPVLQDGLPRYELQKRTSRLTDRACVYLLSCFLSFLFFSFLFFGGGGESHTPRTDAHPHQPHQSIPKNNPPRPLDAHPLRAVHHHHRPQGRRHLPPQALCPQEDRQGCVAGRIVCASVYVYMYAFVCMYVKSKQEAGKPTNQPALSLNSPPPPTPSPFNIDRLGPFSPLSSLNPTTTTHTH